MCFSLKILLSLHLSFTIFIALKLQSCFFLHTNGNPKFYSSFFKSILQLLTPIYFSAIHNIVLADILFPNTSSDTSTLKFLLQTGYMG